MLGVDKLFLEGGFEAVVAKDEVFNELALHFHQELFIFFGVSVSYVTW